MADPHVTVTLGRSGKVVKRGGGKRYTGSDEFLTVNKSCKLIILNGNMVLKPLELGEGSWIARNDLRLKLMRKRYVEERRKRVLHKNVANANLLQCHPQAKGTHLLRQNPPTEILNDFHPEDSFFFNDFHPVSQTIDRSRARSPGRNWTTMGFSAPGSFNVLQQVPAMRVAEVARAGQFSNEVLGASRQAAHMRYPVAPSVGFMRKSALMGVEHLTVAGVLESLGLRKYEIIFRAEEVDMPALKQMSDKDLKELGIPMGPRKKILLAVKHCPKQPPP